MAIVCRSRSMQQRDTLTALLTNHSGHDWESKAVQVGGEGNGPSEGGIIYNLGVGWSENILLDDEISSALCFTGITAYC